MPAAKLIIPRKKETVKKSNEGKTAIWITLEDHAWLKEVSSITGLSCGDIIRRVIAFAEPHMEIVGEPLRFKVQPQ